MVWTRELVVDANPIFDVAQMALVPKIQDERL